MRLVPFLTACLVIVGLYYVVFERDALLAFARGSDAAAETSTGGTTEAAEEEETRIGVVVTKSVAETIDNAVVLRGQTQAVREVEVRAETSARVLSEPKRKGQFVDTGDVLCELDPGTRLAARGEAEARVTEARSRVPEAQARLAEAQALHEEALVNLNAAEKLSEDGYASETRLKSARAAVSSTEAGIASAETGLKTTEAGIESATAALAAADKEIERLTINAPFSGLLESDTAELGSLLQPGSLCATIIQLDPIKLVGFVPETEVDRVKVGAKAGARLVSGREVTGEVTYLSRSADPTTRTFAVEVTVENADLTIRDGQTATIAIRSEGALAHKLPQSALTLNNEGVLGVRVVAEGDIVDFVPVEMLRDQTDGVWVSGLPEEADVIVVGQDFVTEGVKVRPSYREATQ